MIGDNRLLVTRVVTALTSGMILIMALAPQVHADQPNAPILRADSATVVLAGGFVPWNYTPTNLPTLHVAGGKVYLPAAISKIYPGPAVNPVEERTPRASSLRSALVSLYAAAKTPRGGWGYGRVADAHSAEVTVTVDGRTRSISVYALGIRDDSDVFTTTQIQARDRLSKAIMRLETIRGGSRMYVPLELEAWPGFNSSEDPTFSLAFPWPLPTVPVRCTVISAADLPEEANQASVFTVGGERFQLHFRALLPGERGCARP